MDIDSEVIESKFVKSLKENERNEIIVLFHSDVSIKELEKNLNIDQRYIREIWRSCFTKDEMKQRRSRILHNYSQKLDNDIVNEIFILTKNGVSSGDISRQLNISIGVVQKYIGKNDEMKEISFINGRNKSVEVMKKLRKDGKITKEQIDLASSYFYTDYSTEEISKIVGVCRTSIWNIFKNYFSKDDYCKRKEKQDVIRKRKSMNSLIKAGKLGSKPELAFFEIISKRLNAKIIHHDLEIMPPFEIDITIPEYKIAIMWDGIGHYKPIFGKSIFKQVVYRDRQKRKYFEKIGWKCFGVKDLQSHYKMDFIEEQFKKLLKTFPELKEVLND